MNGISLALPEGLLALTLIGILVSEIGYHGERGRLNAGIALVGIGAAWVQLWILYAGGAAKGFGDGFYLDGPAFFFKNLFLLLGFYAVLTSFSSEEIPTHRRSEFYTLVVGGCLAMGICASAGDLLVALIGFQAVHLCVFALSGFSKRSTLSVESAVKVLLPGAICFLVLVIAVSILFHQAQTLNLGELKIALAARPLPRDSSLTLFLLVLLGLSFPMLSFPMFHWVPDGLQGAPTPVSSFVAIGLRLTGFSLFLRWVLFLFSQPTLTSGKWMVSGDWDWSGSLAAVAGATMITGPLLALQQKNAKRLVGALIAGETGILMMGVLVLNRLGIGALLYSLFTQVFSILGVFYVLSRIWDLVGDDHLDSFRGLLHRCRLEIFGLALFLVCLVGLPPSPGFVGKFALIGAAFHDGWPVLSGLAVISTLLSAVAAFRLIDACVGDFKTSTSMEPTETSDATISGLSSDAARVRSLTLISLVVPVILMGIFSDWLLRWSAHSLSLILW